MKIIRLVLLALSFPVLGYAQFFEWSGSIRSMYNQSSVGLGVNSFNIDYHGSYLLQTEEDPCLTCWVESHLHKTGIPKSWNRGFGFMDLWGGKMYSDSAGNTFYRGKYLGSTQLSGVNTAFSAEFGDTNAYIKFDTAGVGIWGFTRVIKDGFVDYDGNSYLINNDSVYLLDPAGQVTWQRYTGGNFVYADVPGNYFINDSVFNLKKFDAAGTLQWQLSTLSKSFYIDKMATALFVYDVDTIHTIDLGTGATLSSAANHAHALGLKFDSRGNYFRFFGTDFRKYSTGGLMWQFSLSPFVANYGLDKNDDLYFLFGTNSGMAYNTFVPPSLSLFNDPNIWQGSHAALIGYKISNTDTIHNGTLITGNVASLCTAGYMDVPFTWNNYYVQYVDSGFSIELSDSLGSFANPYIIGTGKKSPIRCTVPFFNASGTNYRVRVVSNTFPKIIGSASQPLTAVSSLHIGIIPDSYNYNTGTICSPGKLLVDPAGTYKCQWARDDYGSPYGVYQNIYNNYASWIGIYTGNGERYKVDVTDSTTGCVSSASTGEIYKSATGNLGFQLPDSICLDATPLVLTPRTLHGAYSGTGIYNNTFYADSAGYGLHAITYTTFDLVSCYGTDSTRMIFVDSCFSPLRTMYVNNRTKNKFCLGDSVSVDFLYDTSFFAAGTWFYLKETYSGRTLDSSQTSPINTIIPLNLYPGGNFRFMVYTKTPAVNGTLNYDGKMSFYQLNTPVVLTANGVVTSCVAGLPVLLKTNGYGNYFTWHHDSLSFTDTILPISNGFTYIPQLPSAFLATAYGNYWLEVSDEGGCHVVSDTIHIGDSLSLVTASVTASPNPYCQGDSAHVALVTDSSNTLQWLFGNNPLTPANPYDFYATSGSYSVLINNAFNCKLTLPLNISYRYPIGATIYAQNNLHNLCQGDSMRLYTNTGGLASWQWYKNGLPFPSGNPANYSAYLTDSGSYTVMVYDTSGCHSTTNPYQIYLRPKPVVTVATDSMFSCISNGQQQILQATSTVGIPPYLWLYYFNGAYINNTTTATNQLNLMWNFNQNGYYSISVSDSFCTSAVRDSVYNTKYTFPYSNIYTTDPTTFCIGDSALLQCFNIVGENYSWYLDSTLLLSGLDTSITAYAQGNYYLILTDSFCVDTTNIIIINTPCVVGIDELSSETGFNIFPNPATDKITLETNGLSGTKHLLIIDVLGKSVMYESFQEDKKLFDVKELKPGVYFVKLQVETDCISTRFIKR